MNGWLNIYKPRGISSAKAVAIVKKSFKEFKIGHAGTLDLEAEGILPIAIGEATKLVSILVDAKKQYEFTIKFCAKTDTGDSSGKIIEICDYFPSQSESIDICTKFIGIIQQIPPAYSALKIKGKRAYELARNGQSVELPSRLVQIYELRCSDYCFLNKTVSYVCVCSKGTYIRTLAEDISLALQSLGFVIELARSRVGVFDTTYSINISDYIEMSCEEARAALQKKCLKIEYVLDDIPVLEASPDQVQKISFGQLCQFDSDENYNLVWIKCNSNLVAIGSLQSRNFKSSRVFNL